MSMAMALIFSLLGLSGASSNGQETSLLSYVIFGRADFTAAALDVAAQSQWLLASVMLNAVMPTRQDWTFNSFSRSR